MGQRCPGSVAETAVRSWCVIGGLGRGERVTRSVTVASCATFVPQWEVTAETVSTQRSAKRAAVRDRAGFLVAAHTGVGPVTNCALVSVEAGQDSVPTQPEQFVVTARLLFTVTLVAARRAVTHVTAVGRRLSSSSHPISMHLRPERRVGGRRPGLVHACMAGAAGAVDTLLVMAVRAAGHAGHIPQRLTAALHEIAMAARTLVPQPLRVRAVREQHLLGERRGPAARPDVLEEGRRA
jgi:hypothetical protein